MAGVSSPPPLSPPPPPPPPPPPFPPLLLLVLLLLSSNSSTLSFSSTFSFVCVCVCVCVCPSSFSSWRRSSRFRALHLFFFIWFRFATQRCHFQWTLIALVLLFRVMESVAGWQGGEGAVWVRFGNAGTAPFNPLIWNDSVQWRSWRYITPDSTYQSNRISWHESRRRGWGGGREEMPRGR